MVIKDRTQTQRFIVDCDLERIDGPAGPAGYVAVLSKIPRNLDIRVSVIPFEAKDVFLHKGFQIHRLY